MKHENLFKIYIPEPCHEDWDKMTPNEQGAYCKVCAKTVVDFSGKTDREIEHFLLENIDNKVCGRFRVNQLADNKELPRLKIEKNKFEFPGYLQPVVTPFRATALAMMLFGSVMMNGCGNSSGAGGDDVKLAGAVVLVDSTDNYNNNIQGGITFDRSNKVERNQKNDSTCSINDTKTVGKIKVVESDSLKTDTTETMIKGEIEPVKKLHGIMIKKENEK